MNNEKKYLPPYLQEEIRRIENKNASLTAFMSVCISRRVAKMLMKIQEENEKNATEWWEEVRKVTGYNEGDIGYRQNGDKTYIIKL